MGLSGPKVVLVSILIALFLPNLGKFVYFFSLMYFDEFFDVSLEFELYRVK